MFWFVRSPFVCYIQPPSIQLTIAGWLLLLLFIVRLIELHNNNWNIYYEFFFLLSDTVLIVVFVCLHFMSICSYQMDVCMRQKNNKQIN